MQIVMIVCYALAVGLTVAGIAGSAIEIVAGKRLGFRTPFVARDRIAVSLAATLAAGPAMLANEAIAAWRVGLIDRAALCLCAFTALVWATATGIVFVELVLLGATLLG